MCIRDRCQSLTLAGLVQGDDGLQLRGALAALWLIAVMLSLIGGRVIPFFTQRGLGRVEACLLYTSRCV